MFKVQSINLGNGYVYLGIKIEAFVDFFNADVISTGHKLSEGTFRAYTKLLCGPTSESGAKLFSSSLH